MSDSTYDEQYVTFKISNKELKNFKGEKENWGLLFYSGFFFNTASVNLKDRWG